MSKDCFKWLEINNSTTLDDINDQFTLRHLGGIIFAGILMFLGFFGNLIVLWIYIRRFKPSTYRIYTICLAVMDIGSCCTGMPFVIYYMSHYLIFPSAGLCKFGRLMMTLTTNCSAYILIVIAYDRFRRVCRCTKWQVSSQQALIASIAACGVGVFTSWPTAVLFGVYTRNRIDPRNESIRCWTEDQYVTGPYPIVYFSVMCVVMISIMIALFLTYSTILRYLHRHKAVHDNVKTKKTTLTLFVVTAAFLFSEMPYYGLVIPTRILKNLNCKMTFAEGFAYYTFVFSVLLNNAVNPFIYGFLDVKFRREFGSFIRRSPIITGQESSSS